MPRLNGARVSAKQSVVRKAIPLCGIVLVLGALACRITIWKAGTGQAAGNSSQLSAQTELIDTVQRFLGEVPRNERSTFDRFFADDVIYTRATGKVVTKNDILADAGNPGVARANATFSAEEFNVHHYGEVAIVNFKLIAHMKENDKQVTSTFRNTGTFMKRNGQWQAIAWQATPIAANH